MEIIDNKNQEENWKEWDKMHRRGKIAGGLLLITAGSLFLARELGVQIPAWIFTWKMILIGIGLVAFIKHGFRQFFWIVPVLIGGAFLTADLYPDLAIRQLIWPVVLIFVGLIVMFKPRNKNHPWKRWHKHHALTRKYERQRMKYDWHFGEGENYNEDRVESVTFMGAIKKNILSKDFKGGDVVTVFGGTELNLSQAEIKGQATLEVVQVFGGVSLILPAHWIVKSELVSVFGSIEDKRPNSPVNTGQPEQILILRGTVIMGGMEIKSYT
jgi:predicted membrane protein